MLARDIRINDVLIDNLSLLLAAASIHKQDFTDPVQALTSSFLLEALILHERLVVDTLRPTKKSLEETEPQNRAQTVGMERFIEKGIKDQKKEIEGALRVMPSGLIEQIEIPIADKFSILETTTLALPKRNFNWEWYAKLFTDDTYIHFSKTYEDQLIRELSRIIGVMNFDMETHGASQDKRAESQSYFRATGSIKKQAYYLGLSRFLGIPYLPNSFRNKVYMAILAATNDETVGIDILAVEAKASPYLVEEAVMGEYERKVIQPINKLLQSTLPWQSFRIPLPPLTSSIYSKAKKKNATPLEIAIDIRNSKNARAFRKWCNEILLAYEEKNRKELIRLLKALYQESLHWQHLFGNADKTGSIGISLFGINYEEQVSLAYEIQVKFRKHILFLRDMI